MYWHLFLIVLYLYCSYYFFFFKQIFQVSCLIVEKLPQDRIDSSKSTFCATSSMGVTIWLSVLASFNTVYASWSFIKVIHKLFFPLSHCVKKQVPSPFWAFLSEAERWPPLWCVLLTVYFVSLTLQRKLWNPWAAVLVTAMAGLGRDSSVITLTWHFWEKSPKFCVKEILISYSPPLL